MIIIRADNYRSYTLYQPFFQFNCRCSYVKMFKKYPEENSKY